MVSIYKNWPYLAKFFNVFLIYSSREVSRWLVLKEKGQKTVSDYVKSLKYYSNVLSDLKARFYCVDIGFR